MDMCREQTKHKGNELFGDLNISLQISVLKSVKGGGAAEYILGLEKLYSQKMLV